MASQMTHQTWAENMVRQLQQRYKQLCMIEIAEAAVLAEHRRAVRVVKQLARGYENGVPPNDRLGYRMACNDILAALEKGRR